MGLFILAAFLAVYCMDDDQNQLLMKAMKSLKNLVYYIIGSTGCILAYTSSHQIHDIVPPHFYSKVTTYFFSIMRL